MYTKSTLIEEAHKQADIIKPSSSVFINDLPKIFYIKTAILTGFDFQSSQEDLSIAINEKPLDNKVVFFYPVNDRESPDSLRKRITQTAYENTIGDFLKELIGKYFFLKPKISMVETTPSTKESVLSSSKVNNEYIVDYLNSKNITSDGKHLYQMLSALITSMTLYDVGFILVRTKSIELFGKPFNIPVFDIISPEQIHVLERDFNSFEPEKNVVRFEYSVENENEIFYYLMTKDFSAVYRKDKKDKEGKYHLIEECIFQAKGYVPLIPITNSVSGEVAPTCSIFSDVKEQVSIFDTKSVCALIERQYIPPILVLSDAEISPNQNLDSLKYGLAHVLCIPNGNLTYVEVNGGYIKDVYERLKERKDALSKKLQNSFFFSEKVMSVSQVEAIENSDENDFKRISVLIQKGMDLALKVAADSLNIPKEFKFIYESEEKVIDNVEDVKGKSDAVNNEDLDKVINEDANEDANELPLDNDKPLDKENGV